MLATVNACKYSYSYYLSRVDLEELIKMSSVHIPLYTQQDLYCSSHDDTQVATSKVNFAQFK